MFHYFQVFFVRLLSRFSALSLLLGRAVSCLFGRETTLRYLPRGKKLGIPQGISNPWYLRIDCVWRISQWSPSSRSVSGRRLKV